MTLSYVEYITSLGLKAKDGARELLQMALLADQNRMVRRRDVTAERLMVPLRQCRTATTRHIRALIESGTITLVKKNLISFYQLPEIK